MGIVMAQGAGDAKSGVSITAGRDQNETGFLGFLSFRNSRFDCR